MSQVVDFKQEVYHRVADEFRPKIQLLKQSNGVEPV